MSKVRERTSFIQNDLIDMLKVIKFWKVINQFLTKLKTEIKTVKQSKNICQQGIEHVPIK